MTVPVGLMGNVTRAMRFIAAIKPNASSVGGKGVNVACFIHLQPNSVLWGFNSMKKRSLFSQCSWKDSPGKAAGHRKTVCSRCLLNDSSNLCFADQFTGTASPMLSVRGLFVGKAFCQYNCQSTIAANSCFSQLFLSSNRISIFSPNLIKNTPTQLPIRPCWLLPSLSTAARSNYRFMSSVGVVFLTFSTSGRTTCILHSKNLPVPSYSPRSWRVISLGKNIQCAQNFHFGVARSNLKERWEICCMHLDILQGVRLWTEKHSILKVGLRADRNPS